jgi:hypothetical protein
MKKQFFRYMSVIITAMALFSNVNAQLAKRSMQFNLKESAFNEVYSYPAAADKANTATINTRALKDFNKNFKNAGKAEWSKIKNGFVAEFKINEVKTKVYYGRKGRWSATLRTYDQYKLPKDIRELVRSTYYDYDIYLVYEITIEDKTVYLVKIEDQQTIKTIRVIDGEMDVYGEYKKG